MEKTHKNTEKTKSERKVDKSIMNEYIKAKTCTKSNSKILNIY